MKRVIAFILGLVICLPTFAANLSANAGSGGSFVIGTLADANNSVEMALAPEYTRLAVVRTRTANRLKAIANSKESDADAIKAAVYAATQVQQLADEARRDLDGLAQRKTVDIGFSTSLGVVRATIKRAESIYDTQLGSK
jgi:hypothetical protein